MRNYSKVLILSFILVVLASGCTKTKEEHTLDSDIEVSAGKENADNGVKSTRNVIEETSITNDTAIQQTEEPTTAYIATKEDASQSPLNGIETIGSISEDEVKIEMSEGAYQTFVIRGKVKKIVEKYKVGTKVSFRYKYLEGSAAMQIISISKKS